MKRTILFPLLALLAGAPTILAQAPTTTSTYVPPQTPPGAPAATVPIPASGFRSDALSHFDYVNKQIVDLANAIPAEKYSWRPAPGVRSVGEVFVHIAAGDNLLPGFLGVARLPGLDRDSEKTITDKAKILDTLKAAIAHARASIAAEPDANLDKSVKFFGRDVTQRWIVLQMLSHAHEHLGQSIAYARMNGIAPPWSEGR
jgi:uncharacterized damage-inducible protein DinB